MYYAVSPTSLIYTLSAMYQQIFLETKLSSEYNYLIKEVDNGGGFKTKSASF